MLVCVDNGFYDTKVKTQSYINRFKSRIEITTGEVFEKNILEYKGDKYLIGQGLDDIGNDKTEGIVHKLCTLKALGDLTNSIEEFNLVTDLPLVHFRNKEFREKFQNYIGESINIIKQNGKLKKILINKCTVLPQGVAALYSNPAEYKNEVVAIVDIGGLTVDGCIVENLNPIKESIFTINKGALILENSIKTILNQELFLNIQDYEIPYILENGVPGREEASKALIGIAMQEHFLSILREMRAKNWSIETLNIVGIGGGVLKFENAINKYIPNLKVMDNPVYANVNGLYNIGRMM